MLDKDKKEQFGYSHNETDYFVYNEESVLLFPLAFNGEQKKVVDILDNKGNCLLKGGPGTGKTQTLLNLMIDAFAHNRTSMFSVQNSSALMALEELMPESMKKYVLILSEDTAIDDVRLRVKPYLNNLLDLLDRTGSDTSELDKSYVELQDSFNSHNKKLVEINQKIRDLLNLNQQVMVLNGETHTYQMAFDFLNNRKNYMLMNYLFSEDDYNVLIKFNWPEVISKIEILTKNELKFLEMDENLLNHYFMTYPDDFMASYNELRQKFKKLKTTQDSTLRDLNKKDFYPVVVEKFNELKQLMTKYNILLDEKVKQNFIKFFSRRKSLQLIEESMNFLSENMDKLIQNVGFDVKFPSNLHETEYLKDLELLSQGDKFDGVMSKITKKKQKEYFDGVTVFGKSVATTDVWKRIYDKVILDLNVRVAINKWNEHANTFGMPLMDVNQPVDIAFTNLKKNVDVFYLVASAYIQVEQLILPYMDLTGSALENIDTIQTYLNTLEEKEVVSERLQSIKSDLGLFIQNSFLIPKNLVQAQEHLNNDEFDALSALINKEIKEEDSYRPIKDAYVYIHSIRKDIEKNGTDNTVKFFDLILEAGYGMKIEPRDLMNCVKKSLLNQFVKSLNNATILNVLMDEKKLHTRALKDVITLIANNRIQVNCIKRASNPEVSAVLDTMRSLLLRLETGRESKEVNLNVLVLLKNIIRKLPAVALTNYKALDYIPGTDKDFDLVLIDDASQEGFEFLPLILKGKSVVVAGDEKMYAPKVRYPVANFDVFKSNFLVDVPIFLYEMITPSSSLLDVVTSLFYQDKVYLSENVRSESDIFAFVNENYYENSLTPLRASNLSVDASLVDVFVEGGASINGINEKEAEYIIGEVLALIRDSEALNKVRTIGVIALSSLEQSCFIEERLRSLIPWETWRKYKIMVGSTNETQGRERDVLFLSVGCASKNKDCLFSTDNLKVAMTRAKETVYLVHSMRDADLSEDYKGLKALLSFFQPKVELGVFTGVELVNQCKSEVEKNIMAYLIGRDFNIKPNVKYGKFSVDLMVFDNDTNLAIDVEGDIKEQSYCWKNSVKRQLELEEVGWNFYRVLYSQYCSSRTYLLDSIVKKIEGVGIKATENEQGAVKKRIKVVVV